MSIFFSYLYRMANSQSKLAKFIWMVIIVLPVCLLASLRGNVGTDTLTYASMYNGWLKYVNIFQYSLEYFTGISSLIEPGYVLLNRISFFIFDDVKTLFFLSTFVQMVFVWRGITYFEEHLDPSFSLFIYYLFVFNTSLNLMRQSIAVAIIFFAMRYIINHQFLKYAFFVLLASTFHLTALVFIVLYVFRFFSEDAHGIMRSVFYFAVISSPLVLYAMLVFANNSGVISALGFDAYAFNFSNFGWGFLIYTLPVVVPLGMFSWEMHSKIPNRIYAYLFNICLLQIPFRFLTYYSTYAGRLEDYVSIVQVLIVSMLIHNSDESNKKFLAVYFFIWYVLYHVVTFAIGNTNETYPYIFG